ncbi:hypothetical protein IVB38_22145 [Bradyrhizobium sp. 38]|uniref:hypothetical protein n=1 Tax=unclassified Bradyrhizobium TaxID=2631580 RepID=UPI001FF81EEC|nr:MULTISPECIES: hypothetical protein [unclassified Bradyrhizobium]MCK1338638.1 hypothetical protein [Bradyrhizobium sp. 38]MCK1776044.1 hypothetical protein [Bradyrhizobium sp. 132]
MAIEILGVQMGAQHRSAKPDEWNVTYSIDGRHRLVHRVSDPSVRSSMDAVKMARRELGLEDAT